MKSKQEMRIECPQCGTELAIECREVTAAADHVAEVNQKKLPKTAQERIEALRKANVDVSCLFAMQGPNGGEFVVSNEDGKLSILDDDDPIFRNILNQGTVPNRRLFRRFVMAQMFRMLSQNATEMIHRLGYEYQWKMLLNELYAQMKMEGKDTLNFTDRNRWFNARVAEVLAEDYIEKLREWVGALPEKKCKGIPYKRLGGRDIFVGDLYNNLYYPLKMAVSRIKYAKNAAQLYDAVKRFNELRIRLPHDTPQNKEWVDAYKGSGAFYTMQNLIRFHGCTVINDDGPRLDKYQSLRFLSVKAEMYKQGNGWRLLAMLKKLLKDNGIDVTKKMSEWRKR